LKALKEHYDLEKKQIKNMAIAMRASQLEMSAWGTFIKG
jgi:hypothetical protein